MGTLPHSLASLLIDSIWSGERLKVDGEIVVAIPAQDLLLVTGSRNKRGVKEMQKIAKTIAARATYRLSDKLYVYRGGKFVLFGT